VGYSTSIDSPENQKFVADFEAANKAAPDLYGADSYGVLFFYKAAVEKAKSTETDKVRDRDAWPAMEHPARREDACAPATTRRCRTCTP
jgi:ABC-type branched-subunit amino acid transport system substrate-binding protein